MINNKTNAQILKEFDKHVIGHTAAKKMLISLVNRSKTAHYHKFLSHTPSEAIETMNCLLIGGSGTGKTHLVNVLQELVDFPLVKVDATQLGPSGSVSSGGADKVLKEIIENAKDLLFDIEDHRYNSLDGTIDQTIVFIDEVDKLSKAFELNNGNWNKQTQATLLNLLENTEEFKNVSFILAGAFVGLTPKTEQRISIGFNKEDEIEEVKEITDKDVINFGMMPELVGRLTSITVLDKLEYKDMKKILNKVVLPNKVKQLSKFMQIPKTILTKEQEKGIIDRALESGQGARSLKREVNAIFSDLEFDYEVVEDIKLLPKGRK
jgi:ATP-dependent Clp protease ATP-binding subunit ClpX